jgi:hypothetical protein
MSFWEAELLKDYKSVFSRFFFRLIWCSVGGILSYIIWCYYLQRSFLPLIVSLVIVISTLGAVHDIWRLKRPSE